MRYVKFAVAAVVAVVVAVVLATAASLVLGGPSDIHTLKSISDPFQDVDFRGLPPVSRFTARDGTPLAYRRYSPASGGNVLGSVILIHGSSATSESMHPMAQSFAAAGYTVYCLDIRGHGASGEKGRIAYVGQLDDDVDDFIRATQPAHPRTLAGFSFGGGFAMRVAGGPRKTQFDNYLFLTPYINHSASTNRPNDSVKWASVGVPRLVSLMALNEVGITRLNDLPVVNFGISDDPRADLTPWYSYALSVTFQPEEDYRTGLRAIAAPAELLVGQDDEVFFAERFRTVLDEAGRPDIPVTIVPGTGHVALTLSDAGRRAAVAAVARLDARKP